MSGTAITIPTEKISRKAIRKTIREKLQVTLADYKSMIGEKKFESRIRKAARLIGSEIRKVKPKKEKKVGS